MRLLCRLQHLRWGGRSGPRPYRFHFRVQLIHTGQVLPGSFNLPTKLASGVYGTAEINVLNLSNNTASVAAPACTVQQSAVSVTMPVASGRYLPSVGSTTGDTGFSISINCPSPVSVSMTMTDAANPDNVSSTLSLSAASTAKGVGYQIVYNGTAISYGPDSAVMNNVNQFNVGKGKCLRCTNYSFYRPLRTNRTDCSRDG
jgi:Fimbrial protein